MHIEKKTIRNLFFVAIGCIVIYWVLHETEQFNAVWSAVTGMVSPFVLGAVVAFILNVPLRPIEKLLKFVKNPGWRRVLAVLLTFVLFILVLTAVFMLLIPQIVETVELLIPQVVDFFLRLEKMGREFLSENPELMEWIGANIDLEKLNIAGLIEKLMAMLSNSVSTIANSAVSAVGTIIGGIVDLIIGLVFALYCLARKEVLARQGRRLLYAFLPENISDEVIRIFRLTNTTFSNFISGQCLEACILGGLFAISMAILKMPYISLISVLIAITSLVPLVGAFVGCILGAFFILVNDPMQAVWFVVMFLVVQQIEGNLIYPKVVGTSIGLPGMWVLVAVTIGGDLMGVGGMLLMIPLSSVLYTLAREITNRRLAERGIDSNKLRDHPPVLKSKFKENRERRREQKILQQMKEMAEKAAHLAHHHKHDEEK